MNSHIPVFLKAALIVNGERVCLRKYSKVMKELRLVMIAASDLCRAINGFRVVVLIWLQKQQRLRKCVECEGNPKGII